MQRLSMLPEGTVKNERVLALTLFHGHTCNTSDSSTSTIPSSAHAQKLKLKAGSSRTNLTGDQLFNALRPAYEQEGYSWKRKDLKVR
jgi:hypothetical protein